MARGESRVFFPWEKRGGVRALLDKTRARQIALVVLAIGAFLLLRARTNHATEVRSTRATVDATRDAVAAWRADHTLVSGGGSADRACPASLGDLVSGGYLHALPRDAWGRALRFTCPGRRDPHGFDVSSDGPDGEPGGLDRVE